MPEERITKVNELGAKTAATREAMSSNSGTAAIANGHEVNVGRTVVRPKKGLEIIDINLQANVSNLPGGGEGRHLSAIGQCRDGMEQQVPTTGKTWQSKPSSKSQDGWVKVIQSSNNGGSKVEDDWELVDHDESDEDYVFA